ncbi:MAG TPA: DNA cytosine methyltransferase [Spirillospora sp.]|nr:DNA cytosine methyltransferase [Spirillospora sp.]
MRIGSLFSGYGGLDGGVQSVLGGTVAWHSEIDPGACKILAHRYPEVPNLGDITAVDWAAVEPVDVLTGGSPCQDVSAAGKRLGMRAGTRSGLWASMCDAIDIIRPALVVWENVRGVLSAGADSAVEPCPICVGDERDSHLRALGRVVGDLAELGYVGRWTGLRAADVGAPHGRFRVFVLAWPAADPERNPCGERHELACPACGDIDRGWAPAPHPEGHGRHEGWPEPARLVGGPDAALGGDDTAADAGRQHGQRRSDALPGGVGKRRPAGQPERPAATPADPDRDARRPQPIAIAGSGCAPVAGHVGADAAAHTDGDGLGRLEELHRPARPGREAIVERDDAHGLAVAARGVDWGPYGPAIRRWERRLGRPAPAPTEPGRNGQPRLSPVFVEFLMGLVLGWVTGVPGLTRNEMLKALGNGVVPQQAEAALRILLDRARAAA